MDIKSAVDAALPEGDFIKREKAWWGGTLKILPTNDVSKLCLAVADGRAPARGWQPMAEDLIAEDWIVIKK